LAKFVSGTGQLRILQYHQKRCIVYHLRTAKLRQTNGAGQPKKTVPCCGAAGVKPHHRDAHAQSAPAGTSL